MSYYLSEGSKPGSVIQVHTCDFENLEALRWAGLSQSLVLPLIVSILIFVVGHLLKIPVPFLVIAVLIIGIPLLFLSSFYIKAEERAVRNPYLITSEGYLYRVEDWRGKGVSFYKLHQVDYDVIEDADFYNEILHSEIPVPGFYIVRIAEAKKILDTGKGPVYRLIKEKVVHYEKEDQVVQEREWALIPSCYSNAEGLIAFLNEV